MICAPTATRTRDLPLRRSFRASQPTAVMQLMAGLLVVLVPLDACGFCLVRARGGHGPCLSMLSAHRLGDPAGICAHTGYDRLP